MKLRKFGAAFIASAVMMTSAAVIAYADAETPAAAADEFVSTSGFSQEEIANLIKNTFELKTGEEVAEFLKTLDSVGEELIGGVDSIGEEDLGTILALMSPEDAGSFIAWVAEAKLGSLSEDEANDLIQESLENISEEDLEQLQNLDLSEFGDIGSVSFEEWIKSEAAAGIANLSNDEIKDLCKKLIYAFQKEDVAQFLVSLGVADAETMSTIAALEPEDIEVLIDSITDEDIANFKATLIANITGAPVAGNVDAATDSSKGSPDTGIADVAAVAGLAVLALGGIMVAKKRK